MLNAHLLFAGSPASFAQTFPFEIHNIRLQRGSFHFHRRITVQNEKMIITYLESRIMHFSKYQRQCLQGAMRNFRYACGAHARFYLPIIADGLWGEHEHASACKTITFYSHFFFHSLHSIPLGMWIRSTARDNRRPMRHCALTHTRLSPSEEIKRNNKIQL